MRIYSSVSLIVEQGNKKMTKLLDINIAQVDFVDPEAADILSSAVKTVKTILKKREELDQQGQKDQTLYVMKGEVHNRPAHMLHHMLVLKGLYEAGEKVFTGIELPADRVDDAFLDAYLKKYAKADDKTLPALRDIYRKQAYFRGSVDLFMNLSAQYTYADYAQKTLTYNLLKMHVDGQGQFLGMNTDASRKGDNLNASDPKVADLMNRAFKKIDHNMSLVEREGMMLRNRHMAERLYSVAQKHKSRIAVQLCGMAHVNGTELKFHHKDALCHMFKRSAQPVMGIFVKDSFARHYDGLSKDERHSCSLPSIATDYDNPIKKDTSFWGSIKDLFNSNASSLSRQDERFYVNEKLEVMGLGHMRLPPGM